MVPPDVDLAELDSSVRADLRTLPKDVAATVGGHLVMAARLLEDDPHAALKHAQAAKTLASRLAVVREALGIAAYYAQQWQTALAELRTARRLTGSDSYLPMIADCERALGRFDRAWAIYADNAATADPELRAELTIVAAGMRRDDNQFKESLRLLEAAGLNSSSKAGWVARLRYAYAETLLELGRTEQARDWFVRAAEADPDEVTDAPLRVMVLDGVVVTEVEE